eukprot:3509772-Alexandrium_andersonii.AAC.1
MSASLVGSEMCIRDSLGARRACRARRPARCQLGFLGMTGRVHFATSGSSCLLYTSDAADDM